MEGLRRSSKRKISRKIRTGVAAESDTKAAGQGNEVTPVRGVKLKTVSMLTMLFALVCLVAFLAGRPPASTANVGTLGSLAPDAAHTGFLGHDDTRSFPLDDRQRKAGTQKIQKNPGSRAPAHLLLADPQQKHKQPEDI